MKTSLKTILTTTILVVLLHAEVGADPLKPYTGPSVNGVDRTTLEGKVMAGYQGWFNCPDDGAGLGWTHWARNGSKPFAPGNVTVDLWPDMSEATPGERFSTGFKHANGEPAVVFSSHNRTTVLRHFKWMRDYGIDGVFVQRFANGLKRESGRHHKDTVLSNCREGANRGGRTYAVMYDLSGLRAGQTSNVSDDWKMLRSRMAMGKDPAYLHHDGKPLVAIWGIGFNDGRKYTLEECRELVEFFKADGCSVMLGVPTGWRKMYRDSVSDPAFHDLLELADVISPWTPGRYSTPAQAATHAEKYYEDDIKWCRDRSMDFLPVVFPGFSWHNLHPDDPLDRIPRLKGKFLWSQFTAIKKAGASMIYIAMFDEVDEGTAIFKCTNDPPVGANPFLTYEGLPSDHYLWLSGEGGRLLRGERSMQESVPARPESATNK
ncbi:glycoside hydrolase family 71/99-like protein [Haloferula sp.]|uniref:glycoside hydrolase family 71/99-like protein n=1 Tax=Haloferula sp. TaxID=2497595 RepID=UPI003C78AF51